MPNDFTAPAPMMATDLEERASVDSLDGLQDERRELIEQVAPLELQFGSGGDRWTATRRRHRDGIAKLIRDELHEKWRNAGAKGEWKEPSEAYLERVANCDPRHTKFVDETEALFPKWMELKNKLADVQERIANRETCLNIYNAELRMAR